ncbi:MAG: TonB-dependent receptor [Bacteroidetes bacterium]|nr:TonB-dependent receptor [Bacteroidota bacterium]
MLAFVLFHQGFSQDKAEKFTISGYVKDVSNGESLIGANVYTDGEELVGASTNIYGFYSLTLESGTYKIVCSYLGFQNWSDTIDLTDDKRINLDLKPNEMALDEVVITSQRKDENIESTEMGTVELSIEKIKSIPALFGEVDVLKAIQLLPGVQAAGEGNSGIYVRGGGVDQNLVLLDDAIVYNTGHLFGFFSVFNADAVKGTTLIKGGMPAEYGGRLSSVIDVSMKEGNSKRFEVEGGIGLISSRITFQGPFKKDVSSFLVSFRRTYAFDIAQPFLKKTDFAGTNYSFYDLNLKANYIFNDKNRLYLSGYFGRDVFVYNSVPRDTEVRIPWGNATTTLRWNHLFNDKLFMNTTFIFNNYNFSFGAETDDFTFNVKSGIRDFNLKFDIDYYINSWNKMKFGYHYTFHTYTPNTAKATADDTKLETDVQQKHGHEMALYIQNEMDLGKRVKINLGMRLGLYQHTGPYDQITPIPNSDPDTVHYRPLKPVKTYVNPEPRMNMRFTIDPTSSLKAGVTLNHQYAHLVSSSNSTLPTDVWVPSSDKVKPQRALQYALGYFKNFKENTFETSIEVYYKHLWNQIEFNENFGGPELNTELEDEFVFGNGRSYGVEVFFKKRLGDLNGWVGYTYSHTNRKFPELNGGERFPAKYDRTHDISMNLSYEINEVVSLGGTWVFATGNAFTIPTEGYLFETGIVTGYSERNGYRMKAYHRLDLAATFTPRKMQERKFKSNFNISIYNVYNRKNVYFIYYDIQGDAVTSDVTIDAVQVSIFPIIPSFSWNFKF